MDYISSGWNLSSRGDEQKFVDQINNLIHKLSIWRKNNLSYGKDLIQYLHKVLEGIQNDNRITEAKVREVTTKLKEAYKDEEIYWQQKSRNLWHNMVDRNTKYYHTLTKQRRAQNKIVGLYNTQGEWVSTDAAVKAVAVKYFTTLFTTTNPTGTEEFLSDVSPIIMDQMNESLTALVT